MTSYMYFIALDVKNRAGEYTTPSIETILEIVKVIVGYDVDYPQDLDRKQVPENGSTDQACIFLSRGLLPDYCRANRLIQAGVPYQGEWPTEDGEQKGTTEKELMINIIAQTLVTSSVNCIRERIGYGDHDKAREIAKKIVDRGLVNQVRWFNTDRLSSK